jgi:hypothetical protein
VAGRCEHGIEPSCSVKGGGISLVAELLLVSQGLCSRIERLSYNELVFIAEAACVSPGLLCKHFFYGRSNSFRVPV